MKKISTILSVFCVSVGFASTTSPEPKAIFQPAAVERPFFVEDELTIRFKESASEQDRIDYLALLANEGITSIDEFSERSHVLKIGPKARFGESFQIVQTRSDLLDSVSPNFLLFIQQPPYSVNRVLHLASRAFVGIGEQASVSSFVVPGSVPKLVAVRAIGPSLSEQGLNEPIADPYLFVFDRTPNLVLANDNWVELKDWEKSLFSALTDAPKSEKESVVVTYLDPGSYGAIILSAGSDVGVGLIEVYIQDYFMLELPPAQE